MTIRCEVWIHRQRVSDDECDSWDDAAKSAYDACEWNYAYYARAWDSETGEERDRDWLMERGSQLRWGDGDSD